MEILLVKIGKILIQMHFKWCNDTLTQCSIYIWEPVPLRSAQASVRAKVNNSSQIGLGYQQRLMKVVFLSNTWAIWQNQKSWNENNVFSSGTHSHSLCTDWWKELQPGWTQTGSCARTRGLISTTSTVILIRKLQKAVKKIITYLPQPETHAKRQL